MLQILLVTALCLDAFTASLACGISKTKMPPAVILVISLVCTSALAASTGLAALVQSIITAESAAAISFGLLLAIGLVKSFESFLKRRIKSTTKESRFKMKLFDLNFVLTVYADSDKADKDQSKSLSVRESIYLAAALSLDGLATGFGWGLEPVNYPQLLLLSFLSNIIAVTLGYLSGGMLTKLTKKDFSWLGGVILIILAFTKLRYG